MFKRLISCAAGLLIGIAPICVPVVNEITMSASAEDKKLDNGLSYTITDGEVKITDYDGSDVSVDIPSEIEGYPVTSIGDKAFYRCSNVIEITLPNSITSIGDSAFYRCDNLTKVVMSNSVRIIPDHAFFECTNLTEINLPDSITSIGLSAFYRCTNLTEINLPDSVTSIGDLAFYRCYNLTKVVIPNSVRIIPYHAFNGCRNLTKVVIPNSVTSIGTSAFTGCTNLTEINLPDSVTSIGDFAFYRCDNLTKVVIPNSVRIIPDHAFYGCDNLTKVVIPNSVTSIDQFAFFECTNLTEINLPDSVTFIGNAAFSECDNLTKVVIPNSVRIIPDHAFYRCDNLTKVVIPNSVTSINQYAFYECTNLTEINLPDSITSIGDGAFQECTNLTEINLPNSITSIESEAFYKCQSITEINFPDSITRIGSRLFSGYGNKNDNIEKIVFEGDAPIIDSVCFDGVSTTVYYPGDNPTWTDSVLQDYSGDITWIPYYNSIITQQPKNASAPFGSDVRTKVTATGQDLSYQWYYCEANSDKFIKSKVTGSTYECPMTNESNGRKVYCEITDVNGNMVVSDTVTLTADLYIIQQPENASAPFGSEVKTKVTAKGKDLSYQWYYCEANSDTFSKSKVTYSTYECPMTNESNGRKVYCEITDKAGNMVVSDTVTLSADLYIIQQPENASAPFGSDVRTKVTAKGKDLSYQWYYCEANSDTFIKSKVTYSTYECPMTNESNGRKVYCEITDVNGNMVVSDTVTLSIS